MSERLPLFPLGTVLFPGLLLPLHIFEDRYRQLVHELLDGPEPRRFGVIAIRKGRETGIEGVSSLYEVGCTATLRETEEHDDGRFDLVTVGTERFRLEPLDESRPYLQGDVEFLAEDDGRLGRGRARRQPRRRLVPRLPRGPRRARAGPGHRPRTARRTRPAVLPGRGDHDH